MNNRIQEADLLSEEETWNTLQEIECRGSLYDRKIQNWSVWRLFRFPLSQALRVLPISPLCESFLQRGGRKLNRVVSAGLDLPEFLFPSRADYFFVRLTRSLVDEDGACGKDLIFDDLMATLPGSYALAIDNGLPPSTGKAPGHLQANLTDSCFELIGRHSRSIFPVPETVRQTAWEFHQQVAVDTRLQKFSPGFFEREIAVFCRMKKLFKRLLRNVSPRLVLLPDTGLFAIAAAAQELGIPVIEFQHGVFTRFHPDALGREAFLQKKSAFLRDALFLYGDFWKEELLKNDFYENECVVVGNPRIDRFRQMRQEMSRVGEDDLSPCKIVLTMQNLAIAEILEYMKKFLELAQKELFSVSLFIRLHPVESAKKIYEEMFHNDRRVQILFGSETPTTFALLATSHFHVSVFSSSHYDAIGIGIPTIVLPFAGKDIVRHLHQSGHAFFAAAPADLIRIVRNHRGFCLPEKVSAHYFKPHAAQNVRSALAHLAWQQTVLQRASQNGNGPSQRNHHHE